MTTEPLDSDVFLDARAVRRRYGGKSDMALWRWGRDPELGFPKPLIIQKNRYWRFADLLEWERTLPTSKAAQSSKRLSRLAVAAAGGSQFLKEMILAWIM